MLVYDSICQQSLTKTIQQDPVFRLFPREVNIMGHEEQFMKGESMYVNMKIGEQDGIGVFLWVNDTTAKELP